MLLNKETAPETGRHLQVQRKKEAVSYTHLDVYKRQCLIPYVYDGYTPGTRRSVPEHSVTIERCNFKCTLTPPDYACIGGISPQG